MDKIKKLSLMAFILIIVGFVGALITFKQGTHQVTIEEMIDGEGIMSIDLQTDHSKVDILPSTDHKIHIELSAKDPEEILTMDTSDSTLTVKVNDKRKWFNLNFYPNSPSLKVYVPKTSYEQIAVKSDNGSIEATELQAEDINFNTDNGHIYLTSVQGTDIHSETQNGHIELTNITASTTKVKTNNGKILLEHINSNIFGHSNNGRIILSTDHLDRLIDLETDNGKIAVQTETEPTNVIFDLRTDNGKISVFGSSNWDTVIGNGDNLVKLMTNNGAITISK